jgi:hypothetical protein
VRVLPRLKRAHGHDDHVRVLPTKVMSGNSVIIVKNATNRLLFLKNWSNLRIWFSVSTLTECGLSVSTPTAVKPIHFM